MCIYSYLLQKYNICSDNQLLMKSFFTCCIVETAFPVSFATFRIEFQIPVAINQLKATPKHNVINFIIPHVTIQLKANANNDIIISNIPLILFSFYTCCS